MTMAKIRTAAVQVGAGPVRPLVENCRVSLADAAQPLSLATSAVAAR